MASAARYAQAFKEDHLLFEARGWDALLNSKLEASKRSHVPGRVAKNTQSTTASIA